MKKRNIGFDIIRILAVFMVLYNHRECYNYFSKVTAGGLKYWFLLAAAALCKCGPALFFMISGSLLLGREEPFRVILRKRIMRFLIIMVPLAVLYKVLNQETESVILIFTSSLNWYLYAYLGFLVCLPFLRKLVQNMNEDDMILYFCLTVLFYSLSGITKAFPSFRESFTGPMTLFNSSWASSCWHIVFPILGYGLTHMMKNSEKYSRQKIIRILAAGSLFSMILCCILQNHDILYNEGKNIEQIRQHANLLPSCLIFSYLSTCFENRTFSPHITSALQEISACTFGIFLMDTHLPYSAKIFQAAVSAEPFIGRYGCSLLSVLLEFMIYLFVTWLLRRIPYVNKVL